MLIFGSEDKANWEVLKMNEPTLKKAMDTLEFLSQDQEARRSYEERQKFLHDEASMIEWATEQGIVKGEQKKALEIAKNMLSIGLEVSVVAKASGLSEADVESLKKVR
ncbi:Rpn family recombination-promoting nuclease/putative transposase [Paenibacillus filicis]|uniref:Rpn family recombination-promoting nuclease/putative transposase n=1 Tax=Paenibacillus filicis TaxID=669464 RepID=A0ABU9DJU3_9BACL